MDFHVLRIVLLPAGLHVAQPCRYCFTQWSKNGFFLPRRGDTLSGRKCGNEAPKTVKISNFGQEICTSGTTRLQYFYEILSICTRL